jgi:hypothetical protein
MGGKQDSFGAGHGGNSKMMWKNQAFQTNKKLLHNSALSLVSVLLRYSKSAHCYFKSGTHDQVWSLLKNKCQPFFGTAWSWDIQWELVGCLL